MHPMLNVAIQAIKKAGDFIIKQYELINRINSKSSSDYTKIFVSKIHEESDRIISTVIKKFYPLHKINTNKNHFVYNKNYSNNIYWIIESIDNHTNFIKQFPFFALSIAVKFKKYIEIGVIYDPIHNELFSACRGKGAQFNGYRIRLDYNNTLKKLNKSILAISCSYLKYDIAVNILTALNQQYNYIVDFRRTGSVTLDLVYVAIGRLDGCFIISLKKTNKLASSALIIRESGGLITDFHGNEINNYQFFGNIIAGNSKIIKTILPLIKGNT